MLLETCFRNVYLLALGKKRVEIFQMKGLFAVFPLFSLAKQLTKKTPLQKLLLLLAHGAAGNSYFS